MTLPEWHEYISTLTGGALFSKCVAANTQRFSDQLKASDEPPLREILSLFVKQLLLMGQRIPDGGSFDLHLLARQMGPVVPLSEDVVEEIGLTHQEPRDGFEASMLSMEVDG